MTLLIPETEVGIIAPCGPGDVELIEDSQYVAIPVVGQLTIHRLIHAPLTAEQLQVVFLRSLDGVLELLTDLVDIPYALSILLQLCLDFIGGSIIVFLRYEYTGIMHLTFIISADGCPPGTIVSEDHRVVVME